MRICLTKISDQRHALEVVRAAGTRDRIELVTREALFHDFLHYAVESTLPTQGGFWGALAHGKTFADLNDRSGKAVEELAVTLYAVEGAVGMMHGVMDAPEDQAYAKLTWFHESQGKDPPAWCTADFITGVRQRMRQLQGQWRATPYGETMEIDWDESKPEHPGFASGPTPG